MRTRVYVDGYNLYYACLRQSPYKWLSIHELAARLMPRNQIDKTRYFTANALFDQSAVGQAASPRSHSIHRKIHALFLRAGNDHAIVAKSDPGRTM